MGASPSLHRAEPRSRGPLPRGLRLVLGALAVLAVLLAVLYFTLTSGAFLKAVVLPRVGAALHAQVSAADISFGLFSGIEVRQLKVGTAGPQPLFEAERLVVRCRLFGLLSGHWEFPEIVMDAPQVSLVEQPDGKTNLDALLERETGPASADQRREPPRVDIGAVKVTKGTLRFTRLGADGGRHLSEVGDLTLNLEDIGSNKESRLKLAATIDHTTVPAAGSTNGQGRFQAAFSGAFTAKLLKNLQPESMRGDARLQVVQAGGTLKDLAGVIGVLGCDLSATDVRDFSAQFERDGRPLGGIRIRGPIDLVRSEARLSVEVTSIDRNELNLLGAPFGLDFVDTKVSATTTLDVARGGETLGASGRGTVANFSLRQGTTATPPLDLDLIYHFTLNRNEKSAVVHKFELTGRQTGRDLLSAKLERPMYVAWGELPQGINESVIWVAIKDLRLGDWTAFLGTNAPVGTLNMTITNTCQLDGRRFTADLAGGLKDVAYEVAGRRFDRGELQFQGSGTFSDYRSILLEKYAVRLSEEDVPLATVSGSAGYDLSSRDLTVQMVLESGLPQVLSQFPWPGFSGTAGRLSVDGLLGQERGQRKATVNVSLTGFSGAYEAFRFQNYDARVGIDAEVTSQSVNLRRLQFTSRQGVGAFGGVDVAGKYDRLAEKSEFTLNIDGLTEASLQPFLAPFMAPRQLASALINGSGTLQQDPVAGTSVRLQTDMKGLRIDDPAGAIPNIPLDFQLELEADYRTNVLDLRRLVVALPATPRATNRMTLQGRMTFVPTNAMTGQVSVSAEALELSELVDAYLTNRATAASTPGSAAPRAAVAAQEPEPMKLPIRQFAADLKIDRLYVKSAVISNWVATAKLADNTLVVDPFRLDANGAPVGATAKVDLGKPGFVYDLSLRADMVPLGPLVDAFAPDRQGQITGDLAAKLQLAGAGVTASSFQKNLTGTFEGGSTNLNLAIDNVQNAALKSLIIAIVSLPKWVQNPAAIAGDLLGQLPTGKLGDLLGQLTGAKRPATEGWVDEFAKSPIQVITARGKAANGRVELEQARIQSAAFQADARGAIGLAPVLAHSTLRMPVQVSLRRPLAERVGLLPAGTPTNQTYVKVPDFLTLEGTWGKPERKVDLLALGQVTTQVAAGLIGNTGNANLDKAAGVLESVGSLLSGLGVTSTNRANTNAPAAQTNRSVLPAELLDLIKRK